MTPRRRFWVVAGTGVVLAGWAALVAEPLALAGTVGVAGWLLAQQYRFVRAASATAESMAVAQRPERGRVTAGDTSSVTLIVEREHAPALETAITPTVPPGVDASPPTRRLSPDGETVRITYDVEWAVAGDQTLPAPTLWLRDALGLFEQRVPVGESTTVSVDPRAPRDVHVGEGGDRAAAFGEHVAGRMTSGIEPSSVRPYIPGDAVRQIDWKATARLDEPHVREFVGETDRVTVLVVDHRGPMAQGPPGQRKLDFARQVALAYVETARELSDPLGCVTVGDGGLTANADPAANADHQRSVRRYLEALEPTGGRAPPAARTSRGAARAQRLNTRLDPETAFGRRLAPFLERPHAYVERVADQPLFQAVESATSRLGGGAWTVILTDDTDRAEVRETVKVASRNEGGVLVFLTPTVLFEDATGGPTPPGHAYGRYVEFESFRRELAGYPGVQAFEVAPGERLSTVLTEGQTGGRAATAGGYQQ